LRRGGAAEAETRAATPAPAAAEGA
jgi:hypothetical protein